jgi:predicted AlkP superfamily phosphohydrolase/phosphomutase
MNVPVTFPPQRDVQRMVSGFLSPGLDKAAYPDDVRDYLETLDYRIDVNPKLGHQDDKSEFIEDAHATVDAQYEAFQHYIEEDDWDLFFGVFMTTDRVNHFLFKDYERDGEYKEEFIEFYQKVDDYIGGLRDSLPEDVTLIVASDHGFTSLDYEVHFNEWLRGEGWLSFGTDEPEELGDIADDAKAYSFIPGRFYINLEGREPRGSVPESEYDAVRDELKADLEALEGPNGNKVVDRVVEKEEAFRGDHADIAPDLVAIPNNGFDLKSGFKADSEIFTTGPRNGMHSFDDTSLYIDSPDATIEDADLFDITPTILDLMEIEYSRGDFDGTSLA